MTRAGRLIWRGVWVLLLAAVVLLPLATVFFFVLEHVIGGGWPRQAFAVTATALTPTLLLTLGVALLRRSPLGPVGYALSCILGLYAVFAWFVIAAARALVETGDPKKVAGGWALAGLYAAPGVLCLLVVVFCAAQQLRAQFGGRRDLHRGFRHAGNGRSAEAAAAFSRYHQRHPDDFRAWVGLALILRLIHRYEEALQAADRAIEMGGTAAGLMTKGFVFLAAGASDEALAAFEACPRPRVRYVRWSIGHALIELRRLDDAIRILQSEKGWGNLGHPALYLGEAYRLRCMPDAALKAYLIAAQALTRSRDRALLACALAEVGRLREAEEAAQSALVADASNLTALYAQALIHKQRSDLPGLEATIELMLSVSPQAVVSTLGDPEFTPLLVHGRFHTLLGRAWLEQNRLLERIRQRAPTSNA